MLIPFHQLFAKYKLKPTGILHVGAHWGEEADEYDKLVKGPIIWVEADSNAYIKLIAHVGARDNHFPLKACVSSVTGSYVDFNVASNQGQSSSILPLGTHAQAHLDVKYVDKIRMRTITIAALLEFYDIELSKGWFLNIDLQGAELQALKGMAHLLPYFDSMYLEVNEKELYKGCALLPELEQFIGSHGFKRREIKMSGNHGWGDAFYTR